MASTVASRFQREFHYFLPLESDNVKPNGGLVVLFVSGEARPRSGTHPCVLDLLCEQLRGINGE